MSRRFNTIALTGKYRDPRVGDSMLILARHLDVKGVRVVLDPAIRMEFPGITVDVLSEDELAAAADLVVAIGGDGTMLYASRLVAGRDVPLLGINRGRLGFLADITPGEMLRRLDEVLAGDCVEEHRLMLEAVIDNGEHRRAARWPSTTWCSRSATPAGCWTSRTGWTAPTSTPTAATDW
jgi:NAD+ kinase